MSISRPGSLASGIVLGLLLVVSAEISAQEIDVVASDNLVTAAYSPGGAQSDLDAARAYIDILSLAGSAMTKAEADIVERHVARVLLILSEADRKNVLSSEGEKKRNKVLLRPSAGDWLRSWWDRSDPLPATPENELLDLHLSRSVEADARYRSTKSLTGLDDRGEVFVKLGAPSTQSSVTLDTQRLEQELRRRTARSEAGAFDRPVAEFWDYRHIGDAVHYFFMRKGAEYVIAAPNDMVPDVLIKGQRRGQGQGLEIARSRVLLSAWSQLYTDLSPLHPAYARYYDDILAAEADIASSGAGGIQSYSRSFVSKFRGMESQDRSRREVATPPVFAPVITDETVILVPARIARFLNEDGTTRTELYWSHPGGSVQAGLQTKPFRLGTGYEESNFLMNLHAVRTDQGTGERKAELSRYLAQAAGFDQATPVQSMTLGPDTASFHLDVQWDQHAFTTDVSNDEILVGPRVQIGIFSEDSLDVLSPDPSRLEMSDLRPILVSDENMDESGTPYPYFSLSNSAPLALQFELYNLNFAPNDRTSYRVTYETVKRDRSTSLNLRGKATDRTSVQVQNQGESRRSFETVAIDLSPWDGSGEIDIRVAVEDLTTNQTVERVITFGLRVE